METNNVSTFNIGEKEDAATKNWSVCNLGYDLL